MNSDIWQRHAWINRIQTFFLILVLLAISALAGSLLFGSDGLWIALGAATFALFLEPMAAWRLTLKMYQARPIYPEEAPQLWRVMQILSERAQLPSIPTLYYIPTPIVNAFAVGNPKNCGIALSNGILKQLTLRELAGVLAHETAHIAHGDLRVMGLADYISRLTQLFSLTGQILLFFSIPILFLDNIEFEINWLGLILLLLSPQLALIVQLGLSRIREYEADLNAAALTGDPLGLASALARIERASRSWMSILLPGWGNPEPSWLRTHPLTEERIRRLKELVPARESVFFYPEDVYSGYNLKPLKENVRWRVGGLWR